MKNNFVSAVGRFEQLSLLANGQANMNQENLDKLKTLVDLAEAAKTDYETLKAQSIPTIAIDCACWQINLNKAKAKYKETQADLTTWIKVCSRLQ